MTLTPTATYFVATTSAATLVSPSFTPAVGEIIVVKVVTEDASLVANTPTGGSLTYALQTSNTTASRTGNYFWTATATSASSMTVSVTNNGGASTNLSMVVERWPNAQLAGSPAIVATKTGSGAPSTTIATVAAGSTVSWCCGDWAAVTGSATYRSGATQDGISQVTNYCAYYAYQDAPSAGSQTLGLTAPAGQTWTLIGVEIQDAGGGSPILVGYNPDQTDRPAIVGPGGPGGPIYGTPGPMPDTATGIPGVDPRIFEGWGSPI